jgi:hypothetical protein
VYRADSIDVSTTRPEHVLLIVEIPVIYSYLLDPASGRYRDGEVFTGLVKASVPFTVEIDLSGHW